MADPKNRHEVRSFLGLCTYYAKLLTRLMEEKQAFQWTSEVDTTFQALKEALCTAPILAYPQPGEKFIDDTDASNISIVGVLSQVWDGQE
jgi:hypothetical protein